MAQTIINNNDTGLAVRTALNAMFSELYSSQSVAPVKILNQTGAFTSVIPVNTFIEKINVFAHSGVPDIKIGTSLGGNEVLDTTPIGNFLMVSQIYYATGATLYFTVSGGNVDIRIDEINSYL